MPATEAELHAYAVAVLDEQIEPLADVTWADGSRLSDEGEERVIDALGEVIRARVFRALSPTSVRRAYRLLRQFLTTEQRDRLTRRREFLATGPSGRVYRFLPALLAVHEVEKHGSRWFIRGSYCLHPRRGQVPPADVTLAQLLMLTADEGEFLREAHYTDRRDCLWNGEWARRLRRARLGRQAAA